MPIYFNQTSYNDWEYKYFPYLNYMYSKIFNQTHDFKHKYKFFKFIFSTSSGKIDKYLPELDENEQIMYEEYIIKRDIN